MMSKSLPKDKERNSYMTQKQVYQAAQDMIYLINCIVNEKDLDWNYLNKMNMEAVYKISNFHNLVVITYKSILLSGKQENLEYNLNKKWKEQVNKAVRKNILFDLEREELYSFCEANNIWYLPLKGTILKKYYPQDDMRQMADADILFNKKYRKEIYHWFLDRGYRAECENGNHDCYYKEPIYNFEMHVSLFDTGYNQIWAQYYKNIKDKLIKDEDKQYLYHFRSEDFYIYIICHAYKHYNGNGTGLRTLLDLYVYLRKQENELDWKYIKNEVEKLKITEFEQQSRALCKKVFGNTGNSLDELTKEQKKLLKRIVLSGAYGTKEQNIYKVLTNINPKEQRISIKTKSIYWKQRVFPNKNYMETWIEIYSPFLYRHHCNGLLAKIWRILYIMRKSFPRVLDELKIVYRCK